MQTPKSRVKVKLEDDPRKPPRHAVQSTGLPAGSSTTRNMSAPSTVNVDGISTNINAERHPKTGSGEEGSGEPTATRVFGEGGTTFDVPVYTPPPAPIHSTAMAASQAGTAKSKFPHPTARIWNTIGTGREPIAPTYPPEAPPTPILPEFEQFKFDPNQSNKGALEYGRSTLEAGAADRLKDLGTNITQWQREIWGGVVNEEGVLKGFDSGDAAAISSSLDPNLAELQSFLGGKGPDDLNALTEARFPLDEYLLESFPDAWKFDTAGNNTQQYADLLSRIATEKEPYLVFGQGPATYDLMGNPTSDWIWVDPETGQALTYDTYAKKGGKGADKDTLVVDETLSILAPLGEELSRVAAEQRELISEIRVTDWRNKQDTEKQEILAKLQSSLSQDRDMKMAVFDAQVQGQLELDQAMFNLESQMLLNEQQINAQRDLQDSQQVFESNILNYKSNLEFIMFGYQQEQARYLREMELAWVHGSPAEAAAARQQARDMELRRVRLEEQNQLLGILSLLGQHPQLRNVIQSLGLLEGTSMGSLDIGALFGGTLPLDEIPTAQQYSLMSPAEQDNVVNELAGKFGINPEIIIRTIREQGPVGARRLQ